ncbi:hypothetical protein GP5015_1981 [gamma proteobacterium HTCC5015]|nr:hypothetical protein GP5015_1981 [gamma proteobacterium HTCC5015]
MSSDSSYQEQYQELSLVDLTVTWLHYWKSAVTAAVLVFALVLVGMSFLQERYESKVYVELASMQVKDERFMFATAEQVANRLKAKHGINANKARPLPRLEKVNFNAKGEGAVIELVALGETAEEAQKYAQLLASALHDTHQPLVEGAIRSREQEIAALEQYIERVESSSSQSSQIDLSGAYKNVSEAKREIASIEATRAIKEASLPDAPSAPKKLLIAVAGFVLACGIALVLPFLLDFLRQVRTRLQQA